MKNRIVTLSLLLGIAASVHAQPVIHGSQLAAPAHRVLTDVMAASGVASVRVTSTERSAEEQARVMYGYIQRNGSANAYRLYGPEGDAIIAVYERTRRDGEAACLAAMAAETRRQLPAAHANGRLMHTKDTHFVFDVALRSVPPARRRAFIEAARAHPRVSRVLGPEEGEREAIHLEVPRGDRNAGRQ